MGDRESVLTHPSSGDPADSDEAEGQTLEDLFLPIHEHADPQEKFE